ncbi:kelch-like protein 31 isoform X2 [Biomphalaria glabrata]|nr:kelch-like protein 31 isoform X2 [Biomphalaria glabrata]
MAKTSLALSLQTCLGQRWTHEDFSDFTVVVEDMEFECHRFLLASCSGFFSLLLRSDMKENLEKKVTLKNTKKETFSVILNCIYKGEDGLTLDNILDVWHVTHMLDIKYLFEECEQFILSIIDYSNYIQFFRHAKSLSSQTVVSSARTFCLQHFETFKTTQTFMELSFEEINDLIKDTDLHVSSESLAVEAILEWVNGLSRNGDNSVIQSIGASSLFEESKQKSETNLEPNKTLQAKEMSCGSCDSRVNVHEERKGKLSILLSSTRLCLASEDYLENLLTNPLIKSDVNALTMVKDALLFHWKPQHNFNLVNYRKCQDLCNVMAFVRDGNLMFYLLDEKRYIQMLDASTSYTHVATFNSDLFLCCNKFEKGPNNKGKSSYIQYEYFDFPTRTSKTLAKIMNSSTSFFLINKYFIFINGVDVNERILHVQNLCQNQNFLTIQTEAYAKSAFIHDEFLFLFTFVYPDSELQVYTLDKQAIVCVKKIPGPAENIVSFVDKGITYVLQRDGTLSRLQCTGTRDFDLIRLTTIWNFVWNLRGAVCYLDELFLFGECLTDDEKREFSTLPGVFDKLVILDGDYNTNAIAMTIPKSAFTVQMV